MKKNGLIFLILTALVIFAFSAFADTESLPLAAMTELADGQQIDLDGDGQPETISFRCENGDDISKYTLAVGESAYDGEGMYLTERLHAARMSEHTGEALLFVSDYGMSDDPTSYVFSYEGGDLRYIATIDTMPWDLQITSENTFSGKIRGSILQTWYRPCVYVVSSALTEDENGMSLRSGYISEMPLSEYPMGTCVTVNADIALQVSRTNTEIARVIPAGAKAAIVSTDDVEWLYIVQIDPEYGEYEAVGGWLRVYDHGFEAEIDGKRVQTGELFTGLLYAD